MSSLKGKLCFPKSLHNNWIFKKQICYTNNCYFQSLLGSWFAFYAEIEHATLMQNITYKHQNS